MVVGACGGGGGGRAPRTSTGARPSTSTSTSEPAKVFASLVMGREEACRAPVAARGSLKDSARLYAREDGTCDEPFCDSVDRAPKGADSCFVANGNIGRAERELRSAGRSKGAQSTAWDHRSTPKFFERIDSHLHLGAVEQERLRANGFVVLDRAGYDSYAVAFHDVFQQQLPVYISVDAIFNAVFQASQTVLGEVEEKRLGPSLVRMLTRLRSTLASSRGRYDVDTLADLEVYVGVAQRLLLGDSVARSKDPAIEAAIAALVTQVQSGSGGLTTLDLFGRARVVDFSQFTPRGHYASSGYGGGIDVPGARGSSEPPQHVQMSEYFQAMMWLSRIELNISSRSCRSSQPGADVDASETPREARDALALADLVQRTGSLSDLRGFEEVYSVFAGAREDVPLPVLAALAQKGGFGPRDPEAPAKLRAAIGEGFQRTARTHFMPDGATILPAITTMFGPRIVPDIAPLTALVHPAVSDRLELGAADVAYVLGHDRAKKYLAADLAAHPALGAALDASRAGVAAAVHGKRDVYSTWLGAALHLADPASGTQPSFMRTEAFADLRMGSALAVYAQIRHTFVLVAGQGYDAYGCEIPDGWVEPAVAAYDGMLAWVRSARSAAPSQAKYFQRVTTILETLRTIAAAEASGAALTEPQRRWLGMVAEYTPVGGSMGDSGEPPKYTGWYFDLFPDREIGAERNVALVADYFTLTNANQVRHVGIEKAALGVFVVDVGGEPRAMVGPVVKGYEIATPIEGRLNDEQARTAPGKVAPWAASYLAPERPQPTAAARLYACADGARVVVQSAEPVTATITLLDHHGDALGAPLSHAAGPEPIVLAFTTPPGFLDSPRGIEGLHLGVKGAEQWDYAATPSVYRPAQSRFDILLGDLEPPKE